MFTEVNKYRMISKISEDFMNTIGIHFVNGRTERTNFRFLMDDFTCELDFHVGIVNITHCVNMVVTPRKPAPSVSEGFDVELGSDTLVLLEPRLIMDHKFTLPAQGTEGRETCLLFFFQKLENTWLHDYEPVTSRSLHVHFMFTSCSLHDHFTFTSCSLHVHFMFTSCSLHVHFMFTSRSLLSKSRGTTPSKITISNTNDSQAENTSEKNAVTVKENAN